MTLDRPHTIAEIFDRSVTLLVQRWRPILVFTAVGAAVDTVASVPYNTKPDAASTLTMLVADLLVTAFVTPAMVHAVAAAEAPSIASAWRLGWRDFGRVLATTLLTSFVVSIPVAVPLIVWAIGRTLHRNDVVLLAGIIGAIFVAALPILLVALMIAVPIVVLDRANPFAAARIAFARAFRRNAFRTWLLGMATGATIGIAAGVPMGIVDVVAASLQTGWLLNLSTFAEAPAGAAFATVLATVAALDYRVRSEGTDLEAALEAEPA